MVSVPEVAEIDVYNNHFAQREFPTQFLIFQSGCGFQRLVLPEIRIGAERVGFLHEVASLGHPWVNPTPT